MTSRVVVALVGQRRARVLNSGAGLSGSSDILLRFALGFHNYTLTNYPELKPEAGWLKTSKIYSLAVLEAASLKSRCGQAHAPFEGPVGDRSHPNGVRRLRADTAGHPPTAPLPPIPDDGCSRGTACARRHNRLSSQGGRAQPWLQPCVFSSSPHRGFGKVPESQSQEPGERPDTGCCISSRW